jgi:flagellum-specific peptidoglycan hydrolase FlgJ
MRTPPELEVQAAQSADRRWGVFASVALAQWAIESAWGAKFSGKNNPFGIKALWSQPGTMCETHEVVHGKSVLTHCRFRDFDSVADAFDAHARLIATGVPYKAAMAKKADLDAFVPLMAAHYATDPDYARKILQLIEEEGFRRFDVVKPAAPT